ncbi:DUF421 domain-containing protein [Anaerofustis sp.]|uniref:DUF421 domain-containing protein n=1 Tax=Anaerofustis sp. TaxID=1872517 RepID=UPI0025C608BB|nr:DUF421 domain-containing protein [Anaerofustis sp.]
MENILSTSVLISGKTILSFVVIFILAKITGPRQITQLTFSDYIAGITIGSIAAEMAIDTNLTWYIPVLAMSIYTIITLLINITTEKSILGRKLLTGIPTIFIYKGEIIEDNLLKHKYDINDLLTQLRIKGYFDLSNIEYAILETTGDISIMPKESYRPTVLKDLTIPTTQSGLCANIVLDGNILEANLKNMNKDKKWLLKEISDRGYKLQNILLMTLDEKENINIQLKGLKIENNDHYFL